MLSKPKLESSGGSSDATSPRSSASRSRIALAMLGAVHPVRRGTARIWMRVGGSIERRLERRGKTVVTRRVRSPRTGRRHRAGPELADDFSPNIVVLGDGCRDPHSRARVRRFSDGCCGRSRSALIDEAAGLGDVERASRHARRPGGTVRFKRTPLATPAAIPPITAIAKKARLTVTRLALLLSRVNSYLSVTCADFSRGSRTDHATRQHSTVNDSASRQPESPARPLGS